MKTKLDSILEERANRYGSFDRFSKIAQELKSVINKNKNIEFTVVQQEAIDMIVHKLARIVNGDPSYIDNWVDIAGYATLVSNILQADENNKQKDIDIKAYSKQIKDYAKYN